MQPDPSHQLSQSHSLSYITLSLNRGVAWVSGTRGKIGALPLILSQKILKMVDPKQISVIFKSDKKKKKKHTKLKYIPYQFLQERITNSELLSDL